MTDLRRIAGACLEAALAAVDGRRLVVEALAAPRLAERLSGRPLTLIAVGKAAAKMAEGALEMLGESVRRGVVVVPEGLRWAGAESSDDAIETMTAGHPLPDAASVRAGERVRDLARSVGNDDHVLVLLSGGASALMTLPVEGLTLADLEATTGLLLGAGAPIGELNTVRTRLDELKGGGLARLLAPAEVTSLVVSDVVGDRLAVIGSGPLVLHPATARDAIGVLEKRGVWSAAPDAVRRLLLAGSASELDEPVDAGDSDWRRIDLRIIGSNRLAAEAAMREARRYGFGTHLVATALTGEAREAGREIARLERQVRDRRRPAAPPVCVVAGGETTVTVTGSGRGGRNQELALAAAIELDGRRDVLLAAFGTDGIDGPTDAAGAWADGKSVARGASLGLDAAAALAANDSWSYFSALDDLIVTGPTGTNVMDLVLLLVSD